jgi:hypothetical protein
MIMLPVRPALLASIGALALTACQEAAAPPATPDTPAAQEVVEDVPEEIDVKLPQMVCGPKGFVQQDDTRESLAARFGAENIAEEDLPWVDSTETALVLFPNEPATRAELFWLDKTSGGPVYVRVGGENSQWIGAGGLFVGASLADVEAANGGPFEMMGFENHNSGEVVDWLGGAFAAKPGDTCEFAMALGLPADAASEVIAPVSGDPGKTYRSDSPEIRAANPSVDVLAVQFFDQPQ